MKIRNDFITNSSSSSFTLAINANTPDSTIESFITNHKNLDVLAKSYSHVKSKEAIKQVMIDYLKYLRSLQPSSQWIRDYYFGYNTDSTPIVLLYHLQDNARESLPKWLKINNTPF